MMSRILITTLEECSPATSHMTQTLRLHALTSAVGTEPNYLEYTRALPRLRDFSEALQANIGTYLIMGHDGFLRTRYRHLPTDLH
jgi:hypothetical protein